MACINFTIVRSYTCPKNQGNFGRIEFFSKSKIEHSRGKPGNTWKIVEISTCMPWGDFLKMFTTGFILIELAHNWGGGTLNKITFWVTSDDFFKIQYYILMKKKTEKKINHIFFTVFKKIPSQLNKSYLLNFIIYEHSNRPWWNVRCCPPYPMLPNFTVGMYQISDQAGYPAFFNIRYPAG